MNNQQAWKYLYSTQRWKRLRKQQLSIEPLCKYCLEQNITKTATIVDHITPHKGNEVLFYSPDNLQSLCKTHHDSTKAREEARGYKIGCDESGVPLDTNHHWNN